MGEMIPINNPREIFKIFAEAIKVSHEIPPHYGSKILFDMTNTDPNIRVLRIHSTVFGDRMVFRSKLDPNWIYEIELRPVKPEDIDFESTCLERK